MYCDRNSRYKLVLQCLHGQLEDPKTLTHHKLIHAATERVLSDTKSVAEENLKEKGKCHPVLILWIDGDLLPFQLSFLYFRCFATHKEKTTTNPSKDGRC